MLAGSRYVGAQAAPGTQTLAMHNYYVTTISCCEKSNQLLPVQKPPAAQLWSARPTSAEATGLNADMQQWFS